MFNTIAGKYDFLNHFLSFNMDILWRRKLSRTLRKLASSSQIPLNRLEILDVATGTGDMAFELAKLKPARITGVDIAQEMLNIAADKASKKGLKHISFRLSDSESLDFPDQEFDFVTVVFGVRNFENLEKGISEMHRVIKKEGYLLILEFSQPSGIMAFFYSIYSKRILPSLARIFATDPLAYQYLPDSIYAFPYGNDMCRILKQAGFKSSVFNGYSGGIASLYISEK